MPGVHAKIREADKNSGKYLLCPQDFIMKCLSEQSQRAAKWVCVFVCVHARRCVCMLQIMLIDNSTL